MFNSMPGPLARSAYNLVAFATLGIALFVLVHGWMMGHDVTVRLLPHFPAIVPATAACFALLALALMEQFRPARGALSRLTPVLLGAVTAVSIVNLGVLGFEMVGWAETEHSGSRLQADHMSVVTSLGLLLCAGCMALMRRSATAEAVTYLGLFGLASSLGALIGLSSNPAIFAGNVLVQGLSLPTALLFSLVFSALLICQNGPPRRVGEL